MDLDDIIISATTDTSSLPDPGLLQFYENLKNRVYWISGEVDECTLDVIEKILTWNREDKGVPIEDRKPIHLMINSLGGSLDVCETIINIVKISKTPIYTYNMGMAASAASVIYLSGHKRYALMNASWIFHQGSASMSGDYDTMMKAVEDYQKSVEKMVKFYIDNTRIPEAIIREKIKSDWYLYATDSDIIDNGVVDEIITDIDTIL